jgi:long-chain acyl-CoA synthetase
MGPTLIGLLQESVVKFASLAALKSRTPEGETSLLTYAELYTAVQEFGTGLLSIGLAPGQHVAIVAENNPRWLISDFAILGCGGVDVPIGAHTSDDELERVIDHSDCVFAVIENAAALSRVLARRRRLPKLRKIVVMEYGGPKPQAGIGGERVLVYTWDEVMKKGRTKIEKGGRQFDLRAASVTSDSTATLLYTSGTTGRSRGVMLSHGNITHNATTIHASINPAPGSVWLSVLPIWHSFERTVEYCSISFGGTIAYSQPADWKIFDDMRTLSPNYLVIVPEILETIRKSIEKRVGSLETLFIRFEQFYLVFSSFIMGRYPRFRREERLLEIFAAILPLALLSPVKLASRLVLRRKVKGLLGGSLKAIVCGAGPLPGVLDRFFRAIGVDVLEGYGLTEAAPIVSVRNEAGPILGTVGKPLPGTEIRISGENGEILGTGQKGRILVRGPQIMQGYYKDPAATREVLSEEGWLDTRDYGMLTIDGNLVVTGRAMQTRSAE